MDSEAKFWLSAAGLLATVLIVGILSIFLNSFQTTLRWQQAVAAGADPLAASCAIWGSDGHIDCNLLIKH